jgi:hypothetical protein
MAFPTNPTDGQTTLVNNINYVYDATNRVWNRQTTSPGATSGATGAAGATGATGPSVNISVLDANVGSFEIYANANIGTLVANAGSQQTTINSTNANIGAFGIYANANIGSQRW